MVSKGVDAVLVNDTVLFDSASLIAPLLAARRLPSIGFLGLAEAGGLLAYGVDFVEMHRRAAVFVDKIIRGAKLEELPVEQSSRFKLVINMKLPSCWV